MVFRGYEVVIKPRKKDYVNEGHTHASTCTQHYWALRDIKNDQIILKSKLCETKEEAEEASSLFMKRLIVDLSD